MNKTKIIKNIIPTLKMIRRIQSICFLTKSNTLKLFAYYLQNNEDKILKDIEAFKITSVEKSKDL